MTSPEALTPTEEAELRDVAARMPEVSAEGPTRTLVYHTIRRLLATLDTERAARQTPDTSGLRDVETVSRVLHEVMCYSPIHGDEYDPCYGVNFGEVVAARLTKEADR